MNDRTRRPILAAAALSTALAISAIGGAGTVLAQSEEMPSDDVVDAAAQLAISNAAGDAATAAGFTLVTDEMGNTQLVRDADPTTADHGDEDRYDDDDRYEDHGDEDGYGDDEGEDEEDDD